MVDQENNIYWKSVPFLMWAAGSGLVFLGLTFAADFLIEKSTESSSVVMNTEFRRMLPGIAYGYFFGFIGAAVRLAVDYDRKGIRSNGDDGTYFSDKVKVARLFIGSIFGMLAFLLLSTGLLQAVMLGFDPSIIKPEENQSVPLKAILLFGFLAGLFAGETFGSLQKRVTTQG